MIVSTNRSSPKFTKEVHRNFPKPRTGFDPSPPRPGGPGRLFHRLLYAGEFVSVQLIGIRPGRELLEYQPPDTILLVVAFGTVEIHSDERVLKIATGGIVQLYSTERYEITTDDAADLLLILASDHCADR